MEGLSGSLIHWLKTFNIEGINGSVEDFSDGVIIAKVLNNIDSEFFDEIWLSKIKADAGTNWRLKVSNLKKILKGILDYYNEVLGQQITGFRMPDVIALGEKNDKEELGRLLQLILGCAVNCDRKHEYIEALMGLEENIQHDVMNAIQELMMKEIPTSYQSETYADLNNQLKGLTEDLNSTKESKEQITQRCHELDMQVAVLLEEKNSLLSENEKLLERLNHIESFEDPSTLAGKRFQQMQQKLELLQDELFKIETGRDELKAKVENQQKEIIDLQQKNDELQRLAEESQAMKDELDVLRHTSDKVSVYEATIESYKKKLEDMSDLKRQVKLLESKNTHYMQQCMELEEELKKTVMMKSQIDMYKKQVQELQSRLSEETKRADKADFENKRALEKLSSIQQEKDRLVIERDSLKESLEELRCMQIQNEKNCNEGSGNDTSMGDSELLDAVPPEIRERLIRLQHENKILKINEGATVDKQLTLVQSMLDDARSRINELETDNRLANRRILELESQIEDLHANQSAASVQEDSDLKQKLNSAIKRQKEADAEIQNYSVTIESLESQIEVSVAKNQQLQETINRKDEEMRAMEERYRRYLEKAKNVIKTLDPKKNPSSHLDVVSLKSQLLEKEKIISNLEKEADRTRALQDMEDRIITTAFYNLGAQLQKRVADERLAQAGIGQTFLSRQRQATTRRISHNSTGLTSR